MEEQKRSSMILFLSNYRSGEESCYTYSDTEDKFVGEQTNDAPAKCLLDIAKKNNEPIDTIFCIVSKDVFTERKAPGDPSKQTAFERFQGVVEKYCSDKLGSNDEIKIFPIGYDFEVPDGFENGEEYKGDGSDLKSLLKLKDRAEYIYKKIEEKLGLLKLEDDANKVKRSIYIDYTGGLRDVNFLMTAIIRYFEFKGIVCRNILYSEFTPKKIHNIRYIYDMFEMINGVNEFISTGNAERLIDLQKKLKDQNSNSVDNRNVEGFVKKLQSFSAAIALCNVSGIVEAVDSISKAINDLEKDDSGDIFVQMFKTLIPTVKEKLYIDKASPSILDLAQWCLENNMLQQAVTIYNEKILSYYILNNYMDFKKELKDPNKTYKSYGEIKEHYGDLSKIWEEFNDSRGKRKKYTQQIEQKAKLEIATVQTEMGTEVNPSVEIKDLIEQIGNHSEIISKYLDNLNLRYADETVSNNMSKEMLSKVPDITTFIDKFLKGESDVVGNVKKKLIDILGVTFSLEKLETSKPTLWQAMKYYHAVKIIRNSINHVSDGTSDMNGRMREYLEKKGLGKTTDTFKFDELTKDFISNILKAAIACSREVC